MGQVAVFLVHLTALIFVMLSTLYVFRVALDSDTEITLKSASANLKLLLTGKVL